MSSVRPVLLAATLIASLSAGSALAADYAHLPPPPVPHYEPEPILTVADSSGWYLRGDIGVGIQTASWGFGPLFRAGGSFITEDMSDTLIVGAGIGYKFNDWLRVDITGEYRAGTELSAIDKYNFTCTFAGGSCGGIGQVIERNNIWDGRLSSTVFLANAYFDLGTWKSLTPFVGFGAGLANHRVSGLRDFDPSDLGGGGYASDGTKTSFAWALHAGLAYDILPAAKLELSYRYLDMGDAVSGGLTCLPTCNNTLEGVEFENIVSHDLRLGMRWHLGGHYEPPPPIITKY